MIAAIFVTLLLLAVFGSVAFLLWWFQGFWGCLLAFLNTLFAATFAMTAYGPLVSLLKPMVPSLENLLDFLAVWLIFCSMLFGTAELARLVSPTAVRFDPLVERFGKPLIALLTAWVAMAFTAGTIHLAPLPKEAVRSQAGMVLGMSPDRSWLGWAIGAATKRPFGSANGWYGKDRSTVDGFVTSYAVLQGRLAAPEPRAEEAEGLPAEPEVAAPAEPEEAAPADAAP